MKIRVIPKGRPYSMISKGFHFTYAEKNGGLVLKGETSWRKINGFSCNTRWGCFWFTFRRKGINY